MDLRHSSSLVSLDESDDDSDDDYDEEGSYKYSAQSKESATELVLLQDIEYRRKNNIYRKIVEEHADENNSNPSKRLSEKERMHAYVTGAVEKINILDDWRRWRVIRFFREVQGFHKVRYW